MAAPGQRGRFRETGVSAARRFTVSEPSRGMPELTCKTRHPTKHQLKCSVTHMMLSTKQALPYSLHQQGWAGNGSSLRFQYFVRLNSIHRGAWGAQ